MKSSTLNVVAGAAVLAALTAARTAPVDAPARRRGVLVARADAGNAPQVLAELQRAFAEFKDANEKALKGKADALDAEKLEKTNAAMTELQAELDKINLRLAAADSGGGPALTAERVEHRKAFRNFFCNGVDAGLGDLQVKAGLTSQSKPDGGYLVPTEMETTINRVLGTSSVMRQLANVRAIGTSEYTALVNMGGAGSGWVGEEDARTETDTPKLREILLSVCEMYAEPYATQVMLDDAFIDVEAWLADEVQTAFTDQEGAAFISGTGGKRPRGLLDYDTVENDSYAWGKIGYKVTGGAAGFAATNPADALIDLYYALKSGYRANASWLTSDKVMGSIRKMKDGQGNYLWAPPASAGAVPTILEKPVYTDDNMPALSAGALPIAFGDYKRAYLILDRVGIRLLRNPYKVNGKVAFYTTKRVGGGLVNFEAVKLLKCST
ncbi:phage major capsid protein [Asticcacaulis sp.]|uniref:phage major capsid protein n=1 Tax=Asticcacaulis sp. TaxID=1872648 RepID=UPI003F7BFB08